MTDGLRPSVRWTQTGTRCARQPRRVLPRALLSCEQVGAPALKDPSPAWSARPPEAGPGATRGAGAGVGFWGEGSAKRDSTQSRAQKSNRVKHCRWALWQRTVPDKPVETPREWTLQRATSRGTGSTAFRRVRRTGPGGPICAGRPGPARTPAATMAGRTRVRQPHPLPSAWRWAWRRYAGLVTGRPIGCRGDYAVPRWVRKAHLSRFPRAPCPTGWGQREAA